MLAKLSFKLLLAILTSCCYVQHLYAQDSLPAFEVHETNGIVIIEWKNPFSELTQLVVQRSYDSSKGFKSIMSMPDPSSLINGYVDKTINAVNQYYRLFYVQPGGRYFFTASIKPKKDSLSRKFENNPVVSSTEKNIELVEINSSFKREKIASLNNTKDKLNKVNSTTILESELPENIFTPSTLIYSNNDGDLIIALPEAGRKKYLLKVYRENGILIFTMKDIKETQLLVDRSNFYHSGWFTYDLYEEDKVKEKNKFFIPSID